MSVSEARAMQAQALESQSPLLAWLASTQPQDILAATEYLERGAKPQPELQQVEEQLQHLEKRETDEPAEEPTVWPSAEQVEDDYDPRSPQYVQPATSAEVTGARLRLLQQQIAHLKVALATRRELFEGTDSASASGVLEHYQRVLADMLKEEAQLLGLPAAAAAAAAEEEAGSGGAVRPSAEAGAGPEALPAPQRGLGDGCQGRSRAPSWQATSAAPTAAAAAGSAIAPEAAAAAPPAEATASGQATRAGKKRLGSWTLLGSGGPLRKTGRLPAATALRGGGSGGTPRGAALHGLADEAKGRAEGAGVNAAVDMAIQGKKAVQGIPRRGLTAVYLSRARGVRVQRKGCSYLRRVASLSRMGRVLAVYVALRGAHVGGGRQQPWAAHRAAK